MGKYFGTDGFRGEAGITLTADHGSEDVQTISLKDGMMPRKMQLSFRLKKMNKVPSRLKSVQLDITSTWTYNTSKWT